LPSTIVALLNEFHVSGKNSFRDQGWTFLSVWGETPILSREMHYVRIPHQYWRHRLQMMKVMGLIPWQRMFLGISTRLNQFFRRWESGGIYKDCRGGSDDGHPSSRTLCLCRVGIRRVSLVAAEYTRYGK